MRDTCGVLDGQTGGCESVLGVEGQEVHVIPDAKLLVEGSAVGEGLIAGVVHAREVAASWRQHSVITTRRGLLLVSHLVRREGHNPLFGANICTWSSIFNYRITL